MPGGGMRSRPLGVGVGGKLYHVPHRVCVEHSKSPAVVVAGRRQRFCQQCSRFHDLGEFDDDKRSCRRRLAGHNLRCRKPAPMLPTLIHYPVQFAGPSSYDASSQVSPRTLSLIQTLLFL